jgi:hypothetical protein
MDRIGILFNVFMTQDTSFHLIWILGKIEDRSPRPHALELGRSIVPTYLHKPISRTRDLQAGSAGTVLLMEDEVTLPHAITELLRKEGTSRIQYKPLTDARDWIHFRPTSRGSA